jgi:hypothetical protein
MRNRGRETEGVGPRSTTGSTPGRGNGTTAERYQVIEYDAAMASASAASRPIPMR